MTLQSYSLNASGRFGSLLLLAPNLFHLPSQPCVEVDGALSAHLMQKGCSSLAEHLPWVQKAQGSIPDGISTWGWEPLLPETPGMLL